MLKDHLVSPAYNIGWKFTARHVKWPSQSHTAEITKDSGILNFLTETWV